MGKITRRSILSAAPAVGLAAIAPAAAFEVDADAMVMMSALERAEHHLRMLTAAMEEYSGVRWRTTFDPSRGIAMALKRFD